MNMIEVKTAELSGSALDWAVGKVEGAKMFISSFNWPSFWPGDNDHIDWLRHVPQPMDYPCVVSPSTSWSQGGPLIEKFNVEFTFERAGLIFAELCKDDGLYHEPFSGMYGKDHLTAACRAIVAAKLGDTVQVPAELLENRHDSRRAITRAAAEIGRGME